MRIILTLTAFLITIGLFAQTHNSIKIDLKNRSIRELAKLGLDVEHGEYAKGRHFIGVFSNKEIEKIEAEGFQYEILIANLSDYHREHNHADHGTVGLRNPGPCEEDGNNNEMELPENFELGSFQGFYTYDEMIANLDAMAAQYPELITVKAPIGDFQTHEGRPIYWLKISDNAGTDETEPEVLYTAIHHAREPGGLSNLIYFMWHVLENYENDPKIKAMVDETELYFIPCLNPDGYIYNVENYFGGGDIFWRKNRRDNEDGTFGVDLNRNYGYEFGYDNIGSSNNTDDATYRGPSGFSEPETQASQFFCNNHEFQIALNYHTFGNLLIYPWGYDNIGAADPTFVALANLMVEENSFFAGTGIETVGYAANGNSDDWMYGENVTKPAIYSMTPELGLGGFYPAESQIINIIQSALTQNILTGLLPHSYAQIEDQTDLLISGINNQDFEFLLKNAGLSAGDFTVSLTAVSDNIESIGGAVNVNLVSQDEIASSISFNLFEDIDAGETVTFALSVDNGMYTISDTITKIYGTTEVVLSDAGNDLSNWSADDWATTDEDFVSSSTSITDSPNGDYPPNTANRITLSDPVSLMDIDAGYLEFWAKWDIEAGWDYAQVEISTDGGINFAPQCGLYTKAGNDNQDLNEPLYDGQSDWVKEQIDLSAYLGEDIIIRFSMISDNWVEEDGFYFDDMEIVKLTGGTVSVRPLELSAMKIKAYPNPADQNFTIELSEPIAKSMLSMYTTQGTLLSAYPFNNEAKFEITLADYPMGMYIYKLTDMETGSETSGKVFVR